MKDKWGFTEISALRLTIKIWGWLSHPDNPHPNSKEDAIDEICWGDAPYMLHSCPCCEFADKNGLPECHKCPMLEWWGDQPSSDFYGRYNCELMTDSPYYRWMNTEGEEEEEEARDWANDVYLAAKDALEWWLALKDMNEM